MGDKKATAAASEQQLAARQPPTTTKKHVKQARSAGQESVKQERPAAEQLMKQVAPIGRTRTPMENPFRMRSVRELRDALLKIAAADACHAVVLAFDANADGEQPEMRWLRSADGGFTDAFLRTAAVRKAQGITGGVRHSGTTWDASHNPLTNGNLKEPDQRIDFCLFLNRIDGRASTGRTSLRVSASSCDVVLHEAPCDSDHYGVLTSLAIGKSK